MNGDETYEARTITHFEETTGVGYSQLVDLGDLYDWGNYAQLEVKGGGKWKFKKRDVLLQKVKAGRISKKELEELEPEPACNCGPCDHKCIYENKGKLFAK